MTAAIRSDEDLLRHAWREQLSTGRVASLLSGSESGTGIAYTSEGGEAVWYYVILEYRYDVLRKIS